jgi:hypothetical protein
MNRPHEGGCAYPTLLHCSVLMMHPRNAPCTCTTALCLLLLASAAAFGLFRADAAEDAREAMLVVAPESFHAALEDFVAKKGAYLPTTLVALESSLQGPGADDPEKLKRYLYDQWREHRFRYVLLVGDVDVLPVRYMVLDRKTEPAFNYSFYPSDLYYSDLARPDGSFDDWNAQKDGFHAHYYGEVRGEHHKSDPINFDAVDYLPEIAVGRWPVSTPAEAAVVARKSLAYERSTLGSDKAVPPRAAFFAVGGWVDSRTLMGRLADRLTPGWEVERRFYSDRRRNSGTLPPNREELRKVLNAGLGLAVHTGHGQPHEWEQCFSTKDLALITNASALPVMISAGCSTAHFAPLGPYEAYMDTEGKPHIGTDRKEVFTEPPPPPAPYQRDRFNPTCLGEQLLKRGPTGAVAYIGCNTGSQPCGLTLVEGFINALSESEQPRLGDCWTAAIRHYHQKEKLADLKPTDSWYPPSIFFQGMKFMVFGDPSLALPSQGETNSDPSIKR